MAEELKEVLRVHAVPLAQPAHQSKLPAHLTETLDLNAFVANHAKLGRVIVLKSPDKFIKDWIATKVSKSQIVSMSHKAGMIARLCDDSEKYNWPFKLVGINKTIRGLIVKMSPANEI